MQTKDLVSIIIPAYNAEKTLGETIDSLIAQTFQNFQIVVIDDGSKDGTLALIKSYAEKYPEMIKWYTQENRGLSATRNRALDEAELGEYVGFMDADDQAKPDYLQKLYDAIRSSDADIAVTGYEKYDVLTGEVFYRHDPKTWTVQFDNGKDYVFQYSVWAKLYRTDFLNSNHIRFGVGEVLEDGPFSIETNLLAKKVVVVDEYLYRYRANRISSSGKSKSNETSSSVMGMVRKKNSKARLPYNGILSVIRDVRKADITQQDDQVMEYCVIKALAGYCTNMGKYMDKTTRKELCGYCDRTIREYFPKVRKNPYIRIGKLKNLPKSHRIAVRLFVNAYSMKMLYPFSLLVSKVL